MVFVDQLYHVMLNCARQYIVYENVVYDLYLCCKNPLSIEKTFLEYYGYKTFKYRPKVAKCVMHGE